MKRAILLRHATAREAPQDALRELTSEGAEEAARAGEKMAELGAEWAPTLALCSTAARASATLAALRPALHSLTRLELDARLYLASASVLLEALRRAPESEACVLLVAHEPGLSSLIQQLAGRARPSARARLARGMAPGSFACLALDVARWADVGPACGELTDFERP